MKNFFRDLEILSEEELEEVGKCAKPRVLKKGEFLVKEGQICQELVYVRNGIVRSYYTTPKGEEITYCISFGNSMMTALSSFITGQPSPENLQALSTIELDVLQKADLERMYATGCNWLRLNKLFIEAEYIKLEKRVFSFQKENAKERYEALLQEHPDYVEQIPLQYLASYLGVSPRHLSRLRKEFAY